LIRPSAARQRQRHRRRGAAAALLLVLAILWSCAANPATAAVVVHLSEVEWVLSASPTPPADDAGWQRARLPIRWSKDDDTTLVRVWYRARFELPGGLGDDLVGVYLPRFGNGGTVWIDNHKIGDIQTMDEQTQVRWFRPFLFQVGREVLESGRQNVLTIRQQTRDMNNGLREVVVGSYEELQQRYESLLFWQHTMAVLATTFCVVVGTFMIALWLRRRDEVLIAVFGCASLLWGLRSLSFVVEVIPLQWWFAWRATYYAATGGFIAMMAVGLLRFANRVPAWHQPVAFG
jgi:hypothetical protein